MTEVDSSSSNKEKSMEEETTDTANLMAEETTEAGNLMSQGKRNLVCGEVPTAVNQFQDACRLFAKHYGEMGKECAESYYYYGHSLLDLARMETGVLGNALQGVPEEEEEEPVKEKETVTTEQFEDGNELKGDERDKVRLEVVDAMAAKEEAKEGGDEKEDKKEEAETDEKKDAMETEAADSKTDDEKAGKNKTDAKVSKDSKKTEPVKTGKGDKTDGGKLVKGEKKVDEKSDEAKKDEEMDTEAGESAKAETEEDKENEGDEESQEEEGDEEGEEETEDEGKENEENADDVPHLQLAWEMLELAKVIYLKEDMKLKAAESFLKLGEVSLETENYEQSANDFNECLKLQKEVLKADDRLIAETYYQLGLAYSFNKKHDLSIENSRCAIKVIEEKIAKLTKFAEENETGKGKEPAKADDPVVAAHQEIKELREILPDIMTKIEDAEEDKKNMEQMKQIAKETLGATSTAEGITFTSSSSSTTETSDVKVHNISHLVRKKRKPDEEEGAEESDAKKCRQEEGSGDAKKHNGSDGKPTPNGSDTTNGKPTPNGDHPTPNGDSHNGDGKESAKIKVKTVEDVKKLSEEKMDESSPDTVAS